MRRGISIGATMVIPVLIGLAAMIAGTTQPIEWSSAAPYRALSDTQVRRDPNPVVAFESARMGWTAQRILEQSDPEAVLATTEPTPVDVRLVERDGFTLAAHAAGGLWAAGRLVEPGRVAYLTPLPEGGATVVVTSGCGGHVLWQAQTDDPWIHPVDPRPNRPGAEHLTVCDGPAYRGSLGIITEQNAVTGQNAVTENAVTENGVVHTVNRVNVEDYLLGVVPGGMRAEWADQGAAEALRAQAIAARSYVLDERRYSYAQTCDTSDCQEYLGTTKEDPRWAAAVESTAGIVLVPGPHHRAPSDESGHRASEAVSAIEAEYRRIGGPNSAVGTPLGPEMILPQHAGTYRLYTNGVIVATPALGAQVVDFTTVLQPAPQSLEDQPAPEAALPGSAAHAPTPPGVAAAATAVPAQ
ncbi:SpoIID/LytB domain-containing protein [Nocardia sp. CNY236]|uniref:SpoIID/LytB domain-containing protein n=1 Tax=Nocardia sp. CNY236 TaxID=1169152 RepID=UPI000684450F|nr:SpoIID/LytB domain-containing protein [Nocardia sp. CNY236]